MVELIPFIMFLTVCLVLLAGYPVAFSPRERPCICRIGNLSGRFRSGFFAGAANRLFGIMENTTLIAVPLFVFMGIMLEKSRLAEDLLSSMADLLVGSAVVWVSQSLLWVLF